MRALAGIVDSGWFVDWRPDLAFGWLAEMGNSPFE
jgi:hypothetical protein